MRIVASPRDPGEDELGTKPIGAAGGLSRASAPVYSLPARLGRYTLTERIGVGGMAEVFVAVQDGPAGFQKRVVVKRILPHLAEDPRFVEMFQREAKLAAALHHTNIVQVFELGSEERAHFIVMEAIEGLTVHRLARRAWRAGKSLPLEVVCGIVADTAHGLQHAHELGMVHRDISPENLMINTEGVTKILDFGIARSNATTATLTKTGELKGKLPFMSPEAIRGDPVDGRSDLYALGVTMYWLLTGLRPITAKSEVMLLHAALNEVPRRANELNPQIPAGVDALVAALLDKDPEKRPATGQDVYEALAHDLPMRSALSAPFVKEVMALADDSADFDTATSDGFIASSPKTPRIIHGWRRAVAADAERQRSEEAALGLSRQRRRKAIAAGAAAAALLGLGVAGVLVVTRPTAEAPAAGPAGTSTDPAPTPPTPAPSDATPPAAALAPPPPLVPPAEAVGTAPPPPPAEVEAAAKARAPAKTRKVELRGPAGIKWTAGKGRALATGNGSAELPADLGSVSSLDPRRGVKTTVAIEGGVADYAKAPRGKLDLRAFPFAEVFLGSEALGLTPLPPLIAVTGTYTVRFVYKGREEKRTVTLGRDRIERIVVDFR